MDAMSTSRKGKRVAVLLAAVVAVGLPIAAWLSWPYLRFWYFFEPMGLNEQGLSEFKHRQTGIVMVRLPGGTFWMGAQSRDPEKPNFQRNAHSSVTPVHRVTLSPFLMGKHEVTQEAWRKVMGYNPSQFQGDEKPVEMVSWEHCQELSPLAKHKSSTHIVEGQVKAIRK